MLCDDTKLEQKKNGLLSGDLGSSDDDAVQDILLSEKDIEELRTVKTYGISSEGFKLLNILLANASKGGDFSDFFSALSLHLGRGKNKRIKRECKFLVLQDAIGKYSLEVSIDAVCANYKGKGLLYLCDLGSLSVVFSHESSERAAFISSIASSSFEIKESKISKLSIICTNCELRYKPLFFKVTSLQYAMEHNDIQAVGMLCNSLMKCEDGKQIVKEVTRSVLSKINKDKDDVSDKVIGCLDCLLELQDEGFNLDCLGDLCLVKQLKEFTHTVCASSVLLKKVCKTPYESIVRTMCLLELTEVEQLEPIRSAKQYRRCDSRVIGQHSVDRPDMVHMVYGPDEDNIVFLMMQSDSLEIVEKLFRKYDIDPGTQNAYGYTALHFAAMHNARKCAEFLLKYSSSKPFILRKPVKSSITPAHLAAASGSLDVLKLLVKYNLDGVKKRDAMGRSLVHHAAMSRDSSTLSFCIDIGLDVNDQVVLCTSDDANEFANNSEGCTPLHFAIEDGNLEIVEYLLSCKNIDLSIKNAEGDTPITSTMKTRMSNGNTLLHQCVVCDNARLLQKAIDLGWKSTILVRNAAGKTALDIAIEKSRVECAEVLLKHYHDVKYKDMLGNTVFTMLDSEGNTLIHQAAGFGNTSIVMCLLSYNNVSLTHVNCYGETPLDIAIKNNNKKVISWLLADKRQSLFDADGGSYVMKLISKGLITEEMCRIISNKYLKIKRRQHIKSSLLSTVIFLVLVGIVIYVVVFNDKISDMLNILNIDLLTVKVFLCVVIIVLVAIICLGCSILYQLNSDFVEYKKLLPMNTSNMCVSTTTSMPTKSSSSINSDYIKMYSKGQPSLEGSELNYEDTVEIGKHTIQEDGDNIVTTNLSIEGYSTLQLT